MAVAVVLWRHHDHPAVVVFLGGWLAVWVTYPLSLIEGGRVTRALRKGLPWPSPGTVAGLTKRIFIGGFAVAFGGGVVGVLLQDGIGGLLSFAPFAGFVVLAVISGHAYRETVSVDPIALAIRKACGPIGRTRRYELTLIRTPRAELESDSDGETGFWNVVFEYGGKTVRFGLRLDEEQARARARELSRMI